MVLIGAEDRHKKNVCLGMGGYPALRESIPRSGTCDMPRVALVAGAASLLGVAEPCTYCMCPTRAFVFHRWGRRGTIGGGGGEVTKLSQPQGLRHQNPP